MFSRFSHLWVEVEMEGGGAGHQAVLPRGHTEHIHKTAAKPEQREWLLMAKKQSK